jgi:imidazolonepropionase-like amidohydrolase
MKTSIILFLALLTSSIAVVAQSGDLALVHGRVYSSPTAEPIDDATVLIHNGVITAVARQNQATVPKSAQTIDCTGKVIVAGFWNSHVHFQTGWENAADAPSAKLASLMREMLTKWGFTTVWDLGSPPPNTLAIRRRVESGEIPGARILLAGDIFPKNGHPVYLPADMQLTEAATPQEATQEARDYLQAGLDGIKLFTGAYMGNKPVVVMDTPIVKAAVDVAHGQGKPVFTHPQNRAGVDNALNGGVDVLAHTIPTEGKYTDGELAQMKQQNVALIPTLTLWTIVFPNPTTQNRSTVESGVNELRQYSAKGGTILFGTDVGFQSQYDTTPEFELMGQAMSWRDILASLTTNPANFFKAASEGTVEKGMKADLVVLEADPAKDVRNFAKVTSTIRDGRVLYNLAAH